MKRKAAKKEQAQKLLDAVKGGEDMADALTELGEGPFSGDELLWCR